MEERGEEKSIFFSYVYEHRYTVAWALGCAVCFAAVFLLYRIDIRAVVYPVLLSAALTLLLLIPGYLKYRRKWR